MPDLSPHTVIVRRPEPLTAPVDGELVMLDTRNSVYFGLDQTGRRIWELLEEPQTVASLCGALQGEFDVTPEACRADVAAFLEELEGAKLIDVRRSEPPS